MAVQTVHIDDFSFSLSGDISSDDELVITGNFDKRFVEEEMSCSSKPGSYFLRKKPKTDIVKEEEETSEPTYNLVSGIDDNSKEELCGLQAALEEVKGAEDVLSEALEMEESQHEEWAAALTKTLEKERAENDSLRAEVKLMKEQMATLKKEQMADVKKAQAEKDSLHAEMKLMKKQMASLKKEQIADVKKARAEKDSLHAEVKLMKEQVADLKKSQTAQQQHKEELQGTITEMSAKHEEDKKLIKKLKNDLKDRKKTSECEKVNSREMKELKDQIIKLQDECSEKDNEVKSSVSAVQSLQEHIERKDEDFFSLQDKMVQYASFVRRQALRYCKLERDYRATVTAEKNRAKEVKRLTHKNQQLTSDYKRLQLELEAAKKEQVDPKQLQEYREACSRLTEEQQNKAEEAKRLTQENQQLTSENKRLQLELEAAKKEQVDPKQLQEYREACSRLTEEQQNKAEEAKRLTQENQQLTSENKRLQLELEAAKKEQVDPKQLQEYREACSRLTEEQQNKAEEAKRLTQENQQLTSENKRLQLELEAAKKEQVNPKQLQEYREACSRLTEEQQNKAEEVKRLTQENQQLTSENKRLQLELEVAKKEQVDPKQLQEYREACSRLTEAIRKEKDWSRKAYRRIKAQKEEISQKTLAFEKSEAAEKHVWSILSSERQRFEQMDRQRQASDDQVALVSNQLREASALSERLMNDMQTLKMENQDLSAKITATEMEYDRLKSEHQKLFQHHNEMLSKENEAISKNEITITKLQRTVDELTAKHLQKTTAQAELEDALKTEKTKNDELQQRVNKIIKALKEERTTCEQYRGELKESVSKQIQILEERQKLAVALQKAQDSYFRLQDQQLAESNLAFQHFTDTEHMLSQQKVALDEGTRALHHLLQGYTDLGTRHRNISAEYCKLLRSHDTLRIKHQTPYYAQGNHQPEFSPLQII